VSPWKKLLAILGLSNDARVRIRAPGVEVILTGDTETVRALLTVVKAEIERVHRLRRLPGRAGPSLSDHGLAPAASAPAQAGPSPAGASGAGQPPGAPGSAGGTRSPHRRSRRGAGGKAADSQSQVVLPSELDDMDSPYAIPEHRTNVEAGRGDLTPVEEEEVPLATTADASILNSSSDDGPEREETAPGRGAEAGSVPGVAELDTPHSGAPPIPAPKRHDVGTTDPDLRASAGVGVQAMPAASPPLRSNRRPELPAARPTQPRAPSTTWRPEHNGPPEPGAPAPERSTSGAVRGAGHHDGGGNGPAQ
jgi:hypothetical protein